MEALDVDEVVGQLLASEGFTSVEELAYVDVDEIAAIEGFDEDTAERTADPRPRLSRHASRASSTPSARSSAVEDALKDVPGVTTADAGRRSARTASRRSRISPAAPPTISSAGPSARTARPSATPGILDGFDMSREEAEAMIMQARVKAGWITEADLAPQPRPRRPPKPKPRQREVTARHARRHATTTRARYRPAQGGPRRSGSASSPARSSRSTS